MKIESEERAKSNEIEVKEIKNTNEMLNSRFSINIQKLKEIEEFIKLSTSPNTKAFITDDKGGCDKCFGG